MTEESATEMPQSMKKWRRRLKKANWALVHGNAILSPIAALAALGAVWHYHSVGMAEAMYPWMLCFMTFTYMTMDSFEDMAEERGWTA